MKILVFAIIAVVALTNGKGCGNSKKGKWRVTKGKNAAPGAWPWLVSLDYPNGAHHCGGTVINKQWVLTAAHCVTRALYDPSEVRIRIGKHHLGEEEDSQFDTEAAEIHAHEEYRHGINTSPNDIALIKLKDPLPDYTDRIQPICLPDHEQGIEFSEDCVVAGWGSTQSHQDQNILQQVRGPVYTRDQARGDDETRCGIMWQGYFTQNHVCFGGEGSLIGACSGDSGGPLFCPDKNGNYIQYGVVTFGFARYCNAPGFESLYTRVPAFVDWIEQTISEN